MLNTSTKRLFAAAIICVAAVVSAQNYALKWHPASNAEGNATNCIAEWRDNGASTDVPAGFSFVTNATWLAWYLKHSETNYNSWSSNLVFLSDSNIQYWVNIKNATLSNVLWYATNASPLNVTLAASNIFMLRAAEHHVK